MLTAEYGDYMVFSKGTAEHTYLFYKEQAEGLNEIIILQGGFLLNIALILAGGTGSRMQSEIPKQYLTVNGKIIITYCLETFVASDDIDAILIVADPFWQEKILKDLKDSHVDATKIKGFSVPGKTRQLSILNGLEDINNTMGCDCSDVKVMIHDAARPLLNVGHISTYFKAMEGHDGVIPVLPMKDTVYISEDGKKITGLLNRSQVFAGQAPEIFLFKKYYDACIRLMPDKILEINGSTEPAILTGMDISVVPGDERNFKITTMQDLERFKREVG